MRNVSKDAAGTVVTVFAILSWVAGAFALLLGGIFLLFAGVFENVVVESEDSAVQELVAQLGEGNMGLLKLLLIVSGLITIVLGVLSILIGFGLWWRKNWGRILLLVVAWITIPWEIATVALSLDPTQFMVAFFTIAFAGVEIWLFQFEKNVVALFKQ